VIAPLRQSPPADGTAVSLSNVVVVGHVTSKKYGHVYVQDQGGGMYSGIDVFCNYGGTTPNCTMTQSQIDGLAVGAVVSVTGSFLTYTPTSPSGAPSQLEIDAPTITDSGTTMPPTALSVTASDLAKTQFTSSSDPYKGAYVKVSGSFTVSSVTPTEFKSTCNTSTTTYGGFEASDGTSTLAVGLNFYQSVTYCLPGCTTCSNTVTKSQAFGEIAGIVEPSSNTDGAIYLGISPLSDSDLQ
jgi:hypothetical protein